MRQMRVIDGDGHIFEDCEAIGKRLPEPWRSSGRGFNRDTITAPLDHLHVDVGVTPPGSFDRRVGPKEWVGFMDDLGIEQAVLFPTAFLAFGRLPYPEYAIATSRAYNDWLAETYLAYSPRFAGMAIIPMQEPEVAVEELRRCVTELGMRGAMLNVDNMHGSLGAKHYTRCTRRPTGWAAAWASTAAATPGWAWTISLARRRSTRSATRSP